MEAVTSNDNLVFGMATRIFPAVGPMLLISMGYIDPGKWSAVVEGGARFGHDLVLLIFIFNCTAILCQYLAARIGVVTGKNLAQICSEEYNKSTCFFLAIQAEVSVIVLDLTMILGIAHGLNLLFGLNLFTCLLFTATDAVLFPFFRTQLEKHKTEVVFVGIAGLVLACYVFGVLLSQPEIPIVTSGMLTRLSGESVFALMGLLGANIMPHNFYVHSSIIQQQGPTNASKSALCHDHFFAILCVFGGIFLVNYVVMNSAATVFHSAGLVVLTFQDMLLLMDQVFRSPIALFVLFLVMFLASHITAITWNLGGQVVLHELLGIKPPVWLHRATIRMLVIFLSLYCTWNSGAESAYQLLVFTQVILAMLLPSSVIPLFRVASSRSIMGVHKISQLVEFLALTTLIGMLGLNIVFVVEMLFGHSDWVADFWWNTGSSMSLSYIVLLTTAFVSLVFMLWLAATPLNSATLRVVSQTWNWELQRSLPESYTEDKNDASGHKYQGEKFLVEETALEKTVDTYSDNSIVEADFDLPEAIRTSDQVFHLPSIEESHTSQTSFTCPPEDTPTIELVPERIVDKEVFDTGVPKDDTLQEIEFVVTVEKSEEVEVDLQIEKDEDQGDIWEPDESYREASGPTSTSDGPGSFRSLSGKSDEGGNGPGSLSRLSGLGRAARRQLAAILDEFWGQLYDFHGLATKEAKGKQLDALFGLDLKPTTPLKVNPVATSSSGYFPSMSERGPAIPFMSNMYESPKQQRIASSVESPYGFQTGSTLWSTDRPYIDGYVQSSSCSVQDSGERRYSSLRLPPSSEGWDYQPATVHGYQLASYVSRITTDRNPDPLNTLLDSAAPKSPSFVPATYRDPLNYALGQNAQSRVSTINASSMLHNPVVSRNSKLQAEKPYFVPPAYTPEENIGSPACAKKYHSLPDISGLSVPRRDSHMADRVSRWNAPPGFGPSVSKTAYERSLQSNSGSRTGVSSAYDELSSSKIYRESFSLQPSMSLDTKSLWSRQPFEQLYGVAGKHRGLGNEMGSKPSSVLSRSDSRVDSETELLRSFKYCIMKLLKLEGCEWLFKQNGGMDEDLIDRVAASEKFHNDAETRDINQVGHIGDSQFFSSDRKYGLKSQDTDIAKVLVSSVSYCGEGCIWRVDLIVSFGVWCIHRILELSLMESRPELWGKYTYVLNRLQGILDPAFSKPRSPLPPCFCLQIPATNVKKNSPPPSNGLLPPTAKPGKGKCTTASTVLEIIKDVEIAVSCRKGRTGTAAGDVAFPKGKENLASVLKRYKRRLSNKPVGANDSGVGSRKVSLASSYV
ncbi:Divalent metal cation transporter mnth [Thalictrum thalictroides]|uniref:Divalent metal cation transporter mnth n=1 Tax=Thalictrum thalictroides TaxID=46969 RepID=A0A7J6VFE1_THATH|nr:Divalent metal cation transporter mnth [Thalictrum thalictroides]